jgi:hypothetical protein
MEQGDQYDTLIPIQEELSERQTVQIYCSCCTREDIILIAYITTVCCILFGGCIFILVWVILKSTA